jgi:hypothetical protein
MRWNIIKKIRLKALIELCMKNKLSALKILLKLIAMSVFFVVSSESDALSFDTMFFLVMATAYSLF